MNIKQLKEAIANLPDDTLVMTDGYEGGYRDIESVTEVEMILNVHNESWYGPHEIVGSYFTKSNGKDKKQSFKTIVL